MTFCTGLAASPYWVSWIIGLVFLHVTVEDGGVSTYHVIFEEVAQFFHVKTGEV